MHMTIHQTIQIHLLKIGSITNSSVVQIGSTGSIQAQSDTYNSGKFTDLAEPAYAEPPSPLIPLSPFD